MVSQYSLKTLKNSLIRYKNFYAEKHSGFHYFTVYKNFEQYHLKVDSMTKTFHIVISLEYLP